MTSDVMSQFYTSLNLPIHEKLSELSRIIDQASHKDLQTLYPQLVSNIFGASFSGWGLKRITFENNRYEFELMISFLEPLGPMFRLCYKLLSDPQLKYNLPLNVLPLDLQMTLERGRCPQFYIDMLTMDSQSLSVVALTLNPFDYYIFNFALCLVNNNQQKFSWESWNSVYFSLACDYLMHFLPNDPNIPVLPHIPHYTGKVPIVAPLQTANRPLCSPSLLLLPELSGISNQHTSPQSQSRNEVWRSETVLQTFIDIWMGIEPFNTNSVEMYQFNYPTVSSPERVRTVRVLIKHLHAFSAKHLADPAEKSSALRKYARQVMCARAYRYIKYLVTTWPLDASFRLVLELWLSLIQPWRYTNNTINQDRFPSVVLAQEEHGALDSSYSQFIAENFPSYTCIFQLILPRFTRLDITAYKNAVMLFRVGKVFSQPHLVPMLKDLETAIIENTSNLYHSAEFSFNSSLDHNHSHANSMSTHRWVAIAKQAISELNMCPNFEYEPLWGESGKHFASGFVRKILNAKNNAEKIVEDFSNKLNSKNKGLWAGMKNFLMLGDKTEDDIMLEELKKVPNYLNSSVHYFSNIYNLNEISLSAEPLSEDGSMEHSSFANSTNFAAVITNKLRSRENNIQYMGDPDLMPITSYESTILVRILYQISTKLNEMYQEEFTRLWNRTDLSGYVAREVLQPPRTIQTYMKDITSHQNLVTKELPPRISLRKLGSHSFVVWLSLGYILFKLLSYNGVIYIIFLFMLWTMIVFTKASLKLIKTMST